MPKRALHREEQAQNYFHENSSERRSDYLSIVSGRTQRLTSVVFTKQQLSLLTGFIECLFQNKMTSAIMENDSKGLSPRQSQVLDLLGKGFLYREIADELGLSYSTVHTHVKHIYRKLQVRSRGRAAAKYYQASGVLYGPFEPV